MSVDSKLNSKSLFCMMLPCCCQHNEVLVLTTKMIITMNMISHSQEAFPLIKTRLQELSSQKNGSLPFQKSVLNLNEAAGFTGLSKSYMYKLTSRGEIPCYKPRGKKLYFKRTELEDWMLTNRKATTEDIEAEATRYVMSGKGGAR